MNLNQLKIFYMAAKRGSLSLAAEDLFITQPAVTKAIQRLQESCEIKLVNRFGKKLVLTDAGEALFEIAAKIFDLEAHAEESIREFQQEHKGHIRIHASESFGAYYLPSIMNPFSRRHPLIRFSINILPTEQVVENVAALNSDLGFISYPFPHKKVVIREILEDRFVLIVSPDHPQARLDSLGPDDLQNQSVIVHERGSAPYHAIHEFVRKNRISIRVSLELSSNRAIIKAVESGLGIALISRKVVEDEIRAGTLVAFPLPDPVILRRFYLVHHQDKYFSDTLQRFLHHVDEWVAEYCEAMAAR
jgi:DNA-binding transcriptional LysR family regulator